MMDKRGSDDVTYAHSREKTKPFTPLQDDVDPAATGISLERFDPEQAAEIRRV